MEPTRRPTVGVPRRTATIGAAAALATGGLTGWFAATADADTSSTTTSTDGVTTVDTSSSSDIPSDGGAVFGDQTSGVPDTHSGAS